MTPPHLQRTNIKWFHIYEVPAAAAKSLQSCLTLCDPIDSSPPGSSVPGILQARTLEWVAISLSNAWKWKVKVKLLSRARLLATPWIAAYQAPPSMGFSRQEYWRGVPLPSQAPPQICLKNNRKHRFQLYFPAIAIGNQCQFWYLHSLRCYEKKILRCLHPHCSCLYPQSGRKRTKNIALY